MRELTPKERKKRGCDYCTDHRIKGASRTKIKYVNRHRCIHDECPYHVLDKYDTYRDFLKSEDCKNPLEDLLQGKNT